MDICQECPAYQIGSASGCVFCPAGSTRLVGEYECTPAPIGYYTNAESEGPKPCAVGRYGDSVGRTDEKCSGACAEGYYCAEGSTTPTPPACTVGYYLEETASTDGSNSTTVSCVPCDDTVMDCSVPGITVANMPIKSGGWRYASTTTTIIECFNPDACAGNLGIAAVAAAPAATINATGNASDSTNATSSRRRQLSGGNASEVDETFGDSLCAPGHTGFLCGECKPNWHGYKDAALCTECTGSLVSAFLPLIALVVIIIVAGLVKWRMGSIGINIETALEGGLQEAVNEKVDEKKTEAFDAMDGKLAKKVAENEAKGWTPASHNSMDILLDLAFESLDKDQNGFLTPEELHEVLKAKVPDLTFQTVNDYFDQMLKTGVDANNDGKVSTKEIADWWRKQREAKPNIFLRIVGRLQKFSVKLKILVSLWQILMGLGAIFSIPFPPIYSAATEAVGGLVQIELPAMMPVDCIIRTSYYSKLVFKTVWPLLFYAIFGISAKIQRKRGQDGAADSLINLAFLIMFIVYPGVSTSLLSMFYCVPLEDGSSYLRPDLSLECSTPLHATMVIYTLIMLVLHTIGTPAIYCYLFFWKHNTALEALKEQELADAHMEKLTQEMKFIGNKEVINKEEKPRIEPEDVLPGYMLKLTGGYEYRTYWFELWETVRKVLIVGVPSTFTDRGGTSQLFWVC